MAKKELERRSFSCDVTSEESKEGNIIVARPIVYDSRTDIGGMFFETIDRGALNRADLKDVRFLVNHDTSKIPLARSRRNNGNSTMHLIVDDQGLMIEAVLDTENNAEAKALYSAVQRGDISGMSFMFGVDGEEWENLESDHPTRHIKSISSVVEVSAVTFPAYESTEIYARSKETLENVRSTLDKVRQQKASPLESGNSELELLKEKTKFLGGI